MKDIHPIIVRTGPDTMRRQAIREERCLVRVREVSTGAQRTLAVCPGCWHTPAGRKRLLAAMRKRQLEPVARGDGEDLSAGRLRKEGINTPTARHASRCPYDPSGKDACGRNECVFFCTTGLKK
jgi:hypothetical protein